jgi:hypothetical protein
MNLQLNHRVSILKISLKKKKINKKQQTFSKRAYRLISISRRPFSSIITVCTASSDI